MIIDDFFDYVPDIDEWFSNYPAVDEDGNLIESESTFISLSEMRPRVERVSVADD